MSWNKPDWYISPREFADIIVDAMEQTGHFKSDETAHPEDLVSAFTSHAEAIALGIGAVGRKMYNAKKNKPIPALLLPEESIISEDAYNKFNDSSISENEVGYNEGKYANI